MKFWVALVALTLLAGCGADPSGPTPTPSPSPTPTPSPSPSPSPPWRLWGFLGTLGGAAENATQGLLHKIRSTLQELRALGSDARGRVAEYGAEARALLELGVSDLRARGSSWARKFRKRLSRDHEELRKRWEGGAEAIRTLWAPPETPRPGGD